MIEGLTGTATQSTSKDVSSCVETMTKIVDMVQRSQDDYKAKLAAWEDKKAKLQAEYSLGSKNTSSTAFGNPAGGASKWDLKCTGSDNYITTLGGRSGSWFDRFEAQCKDGSTKSFGGNGGTAMTNTECPGGFTQMRVHDAGNGIHRYAAFCPSTNQWAVRPDLIKDEGTFKEWHNTSYNWGKR